MLKASKLPIKFPPNIREIKKISKKEREDHLRKISFYIPRDELRLRRHYNELECLDYELLERESYISKDFKTRDEVILFVENGTKVLEIGGEVLDPFRFAFEKTGLDLKVSAEYIRPGRLLPIRFCDYKKIIRVYKKRI